MHFWLLESSPGTLLWRNRRFLTNVKARINENFFILVRLFIRLSDIQIICNQAKLQVVDRKSRARSFGFFFKKLLFWFFFSMTCWQMIKAIHSANQRCWAEFPQHWFHAMKSTWSLAWQGMACSTGSVSCGSYLNPSLAPAGSVAKEVHTTCEP